jgi:integrase
LGNSRKRKTRRGRVGKVSYYAHHGEDQQAAKRAAVQINAQLATAAPTLFAFEPIEIPELQQSFLDHHEHVLRSSLATITRYRTATQHLVNFSQQGQRRLLAHELDFDAFVRYLRSLRVGANGHVHTRRRPLRDKGVRYILETCRSMYGYAARKRHLPPYGDNPFEGIGRKRFRIEDAKRIFVFDRQTELKFFQEADPWAFPVFLTLAKTGLRVGEVVHLLVEDVDLDGGWLQIRNKVELGWRIKTGQERSIPLVEELALVLRRVIGTRQVGPVFRRARFAPESSIVAAANFDELAAEVQQRAEAAESQSAEPLTREQVAAISRRVWREAGGPGACRRRSRLRRYNSRIRLSHCKAHVLTSG